MDFIEFVPSDPHTGVGLYAVSINNQARAAKVPPCALAAIVSRETGGRNIFQEGVERGAGCGVGLCQITSGVSWSDPNNPTYTLKGKSYELLEPSSNLYVAAEAFLAPSIARCETLRNLCPHTCGKLGGGEVLYLAFAAYNAGFGAVTQAVYLGEDPDARTTDGYASDTLLRYHQYVATSHASGGHTP